MDNLNKWLTLIANVGVVVGLFALVVELDQSSRLAVVSAYQNRIDEVQESQREIALSPDLADLMAKFDSQGIDSLTPGEYIRIQGWNQALKLRMSGQYFQWQQGFLERAVIDRMLNLITRTLYDRWKELELVNSFEPPGWEQEIVERLREIGKEP